jgi:hypothetical protein
MPTDDPERLEKYLSAYVTKRDYAAVQRVMDALGVSKSDALRMLLRAGAQSERFQSFTSNENEGQR